MKKYLPALSYIAFFIALMVGGAMTVIFGMYLYLAPQLPPIDSLKEVRFQIPLRIYSADDKLIGEFGEKRRTPISYDDIPQQYIDAILAAEDDQFYEHSGVSIKGLLRATSQLVATGSIQSGGSTITMQVARNFFLTKRQTFARKFNEIFLALKIDKELSKEEILELYVNVIFLGHRAYGIEAAAQVYYGKPLAKLNLAQIAMIAGLPKAPSKYNPIVNPERAQLRRDWILGRMLSLGKITQNAYNEAIYAPVTAKLHGGQREFEASYLAEMARKEAVDRFGLSAYTDGLKVYTTIESKLQIAAQKAVVDGLITYDKRHGYRGPEHTLPIIKADEGTAIVIQEETDLGDEPPENEDTQINDETLESWANFIGNIPDYGGMRAAVVVELGDQDFRAMFADKSRATIFWDQGLADAKPYLSENNRGAAPQTASDVVQLGDVIRLRYETGEGWQFHQIPEVQSAFVALDSNNGAIQSLVGGFDFSHSHFNRAVQASRQPGSNFKPFIYTAALENGLSSATIINDAPIVFADDALESTWRPENDSGKFYGPTRLRKALYLSRNLVSIRVLRNIGIGNAIKTLTKFGFDSSALPKDLSLSLGSHAVTPLEIAAGYAIFANGGHRVEPFFIERIVNNENDIIYQAMPLTVCQECDKPEQEAEPAIEEALSAPTSPLLESQEDEIFSLDGEFLVPQFTLNFQVKQLINSLEPADFPRAPRVLDEKVAYIINDMLNDVIQRGTGRRAKELGRSDLAGKTGTTNGPTDAWFSGYQRNIVATAWVGFDQNTPLGRREYGGSAALPIWIDFMKTALADEPEYTPTQPVGLATVKIDPETGKRARINDPNAIFEIFRIENLPEQIEDTVVSPWREEQTVEEELF